MNVIAHALKQFFARRSWSVVTAEAGSKSSARGCICVRVGWAVGCSRWRIRARKDPIWRLAVPDERVSHNKHVVLDAEVHISVGGREIITIAAFSRLDERPLQIILG